MAVLLLVFISGAEVLLVPRGRHALALFGGSLICGIAWVGLLSVTLGANYRLVLAAGGVGAGIAWVETWFGRGLVSVARLRAAAILLLAGEALAALAVVLPLASDSLAESTIPSALVCLPLGFMISTFVRLLTEGMRDVHASDGRAPKPDSS